MKHEYILHTWGGFYNKEHQAKHGLEEGYLFFDTPEERECHLKKLKKLEKKYDAHALAVRMTDGEHVRFKTIARMTLVYNGISLYYEMDFGYAYPVESAHSMWKDGNYSCDYNKMLFLMRKYPEQGS